MVTMLAMKEMDLDHTKVNVNGGACALGHPIGASGARIIVTLINALQKRNLNKVLRHYVSVAVKQQQSLSKCYKNLPIFN